MKQLLILAIAALIALAACGQRGPLVLPDPNATPQKQKK
jgi:predicted small lipoprotein YifL